MADLNLANRHTLMASLPRGGVMAEIGVQDGDFSHSILIHNGPQVLYLIDCWEHQTVEICGHDPANAPPEVQEQRHTSVWRRFAYDPRVHVLRDYSLDATLLFPDDFFDKLYFDANHLQLRQDLEAWWPKVKSGGWFSGHDYTVAGDFITVKPVVDEIVAERELELFVTRGDDDIYEKNYPSWAFRKP